MLVKPQHVCHLKPIIAKTVDEDAKTSTISESSSLTHADVVACFRH